MQNGIQRVKPVQHEYIDWPVELQLPQDIRLFNEVLAALDTKKRPVDTAD